MITIRNLPLVTLVGAGPGDIDLITVKGMKAIHQADVIVYDALVNKDLLDEAKSGCQFIFVGKRGGKRSVSQDLINETIVQSALNHGHVVRLKGGDPFVFGRGHEEYTYVKDRGIPINIIPGISSCIAVPEMEKIPVTRRGISESFWVITATTKSGALSKDIGIAAKSNCTLVILMGRRKLNEIVSIYSKINMDTAIMIVQSGTCDNKKVVIGNMSNIIEKADGANIGTPATIVIGDVVTLHSQYSVFGQEAVFAKQVVI